MPEEQEEEPGKYIGVNNDDDNSNGTADYADGTVIGENDLVEINPSITPTLNSGGAMLEAFWDGGDCPIKVWQDATKGTQLF